MLNEVLKEVGWQRKEGLTFGRKDAEDIELDAKEDGWWKHEVREDLRWKAWKEDKDAQKLKRGTRRVAQTDYEQRRR